MKRPLASQRFIGPFLKFNSTSDCSISQQESNYIDSLVDNKLADKRELTSEEALKVTEKLENKYGDTLGIGSGRMVVDLSDRCVLKVSKRSNPFQNKSEALSYNEKLSKSQKELFAPVIAVDDEYRWLTMVKSEREPTDEEFKQAAKKLVLKHGIDITDFQKRNFGVIDGKTVLIDYGTGTALIETTPTFDSKEEAWESIEDQLVFN